MSDPTDLLAWRFLRPRRGRRAGALPQFIPAAALGKDGGPPPSEQIIVGGIGIGNRGSYDLGCFLQQPDVRFVAVCDVKAERREAVKTDGRHQVRQPECATYRDLRELLARKDIDAVLIATGPNWHATATMLAANAGKDVYCEKPCTKNIAQSLILAETFRRTGQVFQAGTQRRNLPHIQFAVELARRGKARQAPDRLRPSRRHDRHAERLGPRRAGAAQGRGRLGPVPRPGGLAAVQPRLSRRLQFRERRRTGRRRGPGMGFPLRRHVPVGGRRRRHRPGRIQSAAKTAGSSPAMPAASSWSSATTAGCRWAPAPCGSRAIRAGSKRATAES